MVLAAAPAAWKSSTTITDPAGSLAASFAIEAVTSADITPSIASSSAASAPNPGATARGAWMNPAQKRTGSASASSHESQDVTPPGRVAAQLDKSTLLPAPADPTTTVRRWLAPASSCPSSVGLVSSVVGSVVGRNFASANRALCGTRSVTARCAPAFPAVPKMAETEATGCRSRHPRSQCSGPGRGYDSVPGTQGQPIGWRPPPRGLRGSFTPPGE